MKTKHSPGPWTMGGCSGRMIYDAEWYNVADSDLKANARLIAAAPELLKALEMCALVLSGEEMTKYSLVKALELAQNAMRKAKGDT